MTLKNTPKTLQKREKSTTILIAIVKRAITIDHIINFFLDHPVEPKKISLTVYFIHAQN